MQYNLLVGFLWCKLMPVWSLVSSMTDIGVTITCIGECVIVLFRLLPKFALGHHKRNLKWCPQPPNLVFFWNWLPLVQPFPIGWSWWPHTSAWCSWRSPPCTPCCRSAGSLSHSAPHKLFSDEGARSGLRFYIPLSSSRWEQWHSWTHWVVGSSFKGRV